jgi:hypothetical protein
MGMGAAACYAETIEVDDLKKIVPEAYKAFEDSLDAAGIEFDGFCQVCQFDDLSEGHIHSLAEWHEVSEEVARSVIDAYCAVDNKFNEVTGMVLFPVYRDEDQGDIYDQLIGGGWHVEGARIKSEACKTMEEKFGVTVNQTVWTNFG